MKKVFALVALCIATISIWAQNTQEKENCTLNTNPHHFTMSIGYGHMLSDMADTNIFINYKNEDHQRRMHYGYNIELDYEYQFHKNFACGAVFSMYNSFDSWYPSNDTLGNTNSDDKYIFYVGPSFLAQTNLLGDKWTIYGRATIGYLNFRNAMRAATNATYKMGTLGYGIEAGCDYLVNQYFSIIGQVSYLGGSISKVKNSADMEFELQDSEDISRLNISLGVKIKL
ncbi:MAG: outer membrane beta-barrel protein [Bacteroidales bacterium]|nr:outer membrane beta-barrel protein [Bacteroidales bacterium]